MGVAGVGGGIGWLIAAVFGLLAVAAGGLAFVAPWWAAVPLAVLTALLMIGVVVVVAAMVALREGW